MKSRKLINQLFSYGFSFSVSHFRILYAIEKGGSNYLQAGVAVSSKNFRKAVERNRIKRLVRETWRLQKSGLEESLVVQNISLLVFIIYTRNEIPDYHELFNQMTSVLKRLSKILNEETTPNT